MLCEAPLSRLPRFSDSGLALSKRKRTPDETLSDQQIVSVALDQIRRHGADRLSMRQLAKALGVTPMTIYYYVGNKDALFARCADAVLARVPRPAPSGRDWQREIKDCALHGFRLLLEYPGLCGEIIKRPPTQQRIELASYGIAILVAAGFEPTAATQATVIAQTFVFGMIGLQAQIELEQRAARKKNRRGTAPNERLLSADLPALVDFGLDALLIGFGEKLLQPARPKTRAAATSRE